MQHTPTQPRARRQDPDTSQQAAFSFDEKTLIRNELAILAVFLQVGHPMTDEELVENYGQLSSGEGGLIPRQSPSGIRSRRSALSDPNGSYFERTGKKRATISGGKAHVWWWRAGRREIGRDLLGAWHG